MIEGLTEWIDRQVRLAKFYGFEDLTHKRILLMEMMQTFYPGSNFN